MAGESGEPRLAQRGRTTAVALVSLVALVALGAIVTDALPWLRGPAPYPPEWQWGWREAPGRAPVLASLLALALLALVAASLGPRWRARPRAAARLLLAAASVGGLSFSVALLQREPDGALRWLMARTQSFSITSYHSVAVSEDARSPLAFLRAHARLLPDLARTAKHAATHPPGPVLWYRAAVAACASSPSLTAGLLALAGAPGPETQSPERRAARAGALLGALGLAALAALTVWPLARLAEGAGLAPLDAARTAAAFVLLPGPALFAGSLDAALALPVTAWAALLLCAASDPRARRATALAAAAGACGAAALFASYGSVAFLGLASLAVAAATARDRASLLRLSRAAAVAGALALLLAFGLPALLGHEPLLALRTALALHHAEYTAPRSYALWLAFDPLDLALFAGLPFALLAAWRSAGAIGRTAALTRLDRLRWATLGGLAALVLAGVTRGEVGRIWIPLVPLLVLASAGDDEPPGLATTVLPAALAAAFTLAMSSSWSF
jgi:hypothetical protein